MGILAPLAAFSASLVGTIVGSNLKLQDASGESLTISGAGWRWSHTPNDRLTTTGTTYATGGQLKYKNNTQRTMRVLYISLVPDSGFKTKGSVQVRINEIGVFFNKFGYFTDIASKTIDFGNGGFELPAGAEINIQTASSDGTSVSLTAEALVAQ